MSKILGAQQKVSPGFNDFVKIPSLISVPNTTIVNRAQIPDLASDLLPRFGFNRIPVKSGFIKNKEVGANGEIVFGVVGDIFDQIRFVGAGWELGPGDNTLFSGPGFITDRINDYVEITFYGTGLNWLTTTYTSGTIDYRVSVDGGAEGANINNAGFSEILRNRNYAPNQSIPIVSGLVEGIHTVKIRSNSSTGQRFVVHGFEIINKNLQIKTNPGFSYIDGILRELIAQDAQNYNTAFESGTLGTKGGRVLVYQKADGSIAKVVNPVDASQLNIFSADHSNEEVVRTFHWREFGAGRADDFSTLFTSGATRAFTLDDGVTSLAGGTNLNTSAQAFGGPYTNFAPGAPDALYIGSPEGITFTFVGTGLDVEFACGSPEIETYQFIIDGITIAASQVLTSIQADRKVFKVVSGLPYGTHTFKMTRSVSLTSNMGIINFLVYQPKKPTLPEHAIEIADYNILADYVASTDIAPNVVNIATGVLRKSSNREWVYVHPGSFAIIAIDLPRSPSLFTAINSQTVTGGYAEVMFYGTGFEFRGGTAVGYANIGLISLQDLGNGGGLLALTSANFPSVSASYTGTGSFTLGTGAYSQQGAGGTDILRITGLPLGFYKLRIQNNSSTSGVYQQYHSLDVITPIHSYRSDSNNIQNTELIGNQSIGDLRTFTPNEVDDSKKFRATAFGISNDPSTSSTTFITVPDLKLSVKSKGSWFRIGYSITCINSAGAAEQFRIYVNGIGRGKARMVGNISGIHFLAADSILIYLESGTHHVELYWRAISSTVSSAQDLRSLTVEELGD